MSYVALYRKFRPQTFAEVKGQDHVVRTLKNQIKNNRIGHAYLFTGTRGTGKTSVAKIMAKAVNCLEPMDGEPCNKCKNCLAVNDGSFIDVVEMDAASNNGVADIRQVIDEVQFTPVSGKYKVFIIDEAHMITKPAFNAFLKTLEEPPAYAVFLLATTEPHKLPQTILSRLQRYDFKRISTEEISENLKVLVEKEGSDCEDKAVDYIARLGDGSMRDSISLLDKCLAFSLGEKLTYESVLDALGAADIEIFSKLFNAVYKGDSAAALNVIDRAAAEGKDMTQFVTDFCGYLRNLMLVGINANAAENIIGVSAENMELLKADANAADTDVLIRYIRILSELINQLRFSQVKQILTEVAVIKLSRPQMETDSESVLDRIRQLEQRPVQTVSLPAEKAEPEIKAAEKIPEERAERKEPDMIPVQESLSNEPSGSRAFPKWKNIVDSIDSMQLKIALKRASARDENGTLAIYAEGIVAKGTIKAGLDEIKKTASRVTGRDMEITVKDGVPDDSGADDLFRDIHFEIGTEEF